MPIAARDFPSLRGAALIAGVLLHAATPAHAQSDLAAKGKYLTDMGDCQACHTAPGGTPFAGGLMMNTPFGPISTPNITPDKETGIGAYTDDQFVRVFHEGIGKEGEYLYPVMPFPWYTKVTNDDVLAIKAYLFSLDPVHAPRKPLQLSFPFNIRAGLAAWDAAFLIKGVFQPDPAKSDQVNRGAYIVEGLGHCGECHDSRNMLGAGQIAKPLQGGQIDHWYAPNITSDIRTGIGRFSDDEVFQYLKTGSSPNMGTVVGPMAQTQHDSLAKLTDDDLRAIVAYLKSTQPAASFKETVTPGLTNAQGTAVQAYLNHCASCHQLDGKGIANVVPSLVGNGLTVSGGPESVVRVIVGGLPAEGSYGPMPAVGIGMTDQEISDATNYVRSAWGNNAPATVGPGEVAKLRSETVSYLSGTNPNGCPDLAQKDMQDVVADPSMQSLLRDINPDNMLQSVNAILGKVRAANATIAQADLVNGLTIAYCPIVRAKPGLSPGQQLAQLNQFQERLYTQASQGGKD